MADLPTKSQLDIRMIFLIAYDRKAGCIRSIHTFKDGERDHVEGIRLKMEIDNRDDFEIVLLESDDAAMLRKTHARYFKSAVELLDSQTS